MNTKKVSIRVSFLFLFLMVGLFHLCGQKSAEKSVSLFFRPMFREENLDLAKKYSMENGDSIQLHVFKFYVSGIEFIDNNSCVFHEPHSYHLIDAANSSTFNVQIKRNENVKSDGLQFLLGIDSATNAAGIGSQDLDPTKGMYWAWQSGYINMKIEGEIFHANHQRETFEFHLGGFLPPFLACQHIRLSGLQNNLSTSIVIHTNVDKFLSQIDFSKKQQVMSPSEKAVMLSQKTVSMFSIFQR